MFCQECGNQLKDDTKFCNGCGTKVSKKETEQHQNQQGPIEEQAPKEKNYTVCEPFQPFSSLDPVQPIYQKTAFKGKQASVGTSGGIKFNKGTKKGGCLKTIFIAIGIMIALVVALVFFSDSSIGSVQTALSIDSGTLEPINKASTFGSDTPEIFVTFTLSNLPIGTAVKSDWIYLDEDILITDARIKTTEDNQNAYFSLSRPNNGWPVGDYEVKLYVEDAYKKSAKFSVK